MSANNVVHLGKVPESEEQKRECIAAAEALLALAKAGEITAIIAICDVNGPEWREISTLHGNLFELLGKARMFEHMLLSRLTGAVQ